MIVTLTADIKEFLIRNGYANLYRIQYPPKPDDIISVHEREAPNAFGESGINYGGRTAPVQIRVRRKTIDEAEQTAWDIFALLDSGPDERRISLTPGRSITSRPRPPFFLSIDDEGRSTYVVKAFITTRTE